MCDPGEKVSLTLCREFMEEATNSLQMNEVDKKKLQETLKKFFAGGQEVSYD